MAPSSAETMPRHLARAAPGPRGRQPEREVAGADNRADGLINALDRVVEIAGGDRAAPLTHDGSASRIEHVSAG
jgi:hypothetical protein